MKLFAILSIFCILSIAGVAQTTSIASLQIGDKAPDVTINNITNYTGGSARISDFKDKLLILDFWGIHCSSCIEEMPRLQEFQKRFGDSIQVLLVTQDSKKEVDALFQKFKFLHNIKLARAAGDTVLSKVFPYSGLGLNVWIDGKGIVKQKTESISYTARDIEDFLHGGEVHLPLRNEKTDFNVNVPLWLEGNGRQVPHIKYYSLIGENTPDIIGTHGLNWIKDSITKKIVGIRQINTTIKSLYALAFSEFDKRTWYKIIWENIKDSSKYFFPKDPSKHYEWSLKNTYCYELHVPTEKSGQFYTIMQQDLERYFDLKGNVEKRKMKCMVLIRVDRTEGLLHTNGGKPSMEWLQNKERNPIDSVILNNEPLELFAYESLRWSWKQLLKAGSDEDGVIVLDETNYKNPVDLYLHVVPGDYNSLRKELRRYGLDLIEAYRDLDALVLRENETQTINQIPFKN